MSILADAFQAELFRQLEERLLQAEVRQSAPELAELLADDFIEFGSSGRVFNKSQIIASLSHETPERRSLTEFKAVFLAPGVVLTTYRAFRHRATDTPITSLRSSIWKLIEGRWQMIFHQGTPAG